MFSASSSSRLRVRAALWALLVSTTTTQAATSCTFSGASGAAQASSAQSACATIVLSNVAVPAGQTLSLEKLNDGTHVIFEGTTTFGYAEWTGPLVAISGKSITVTGAAGAVLDGDGSRWWDGQGSNGGKTKPKFFAAHNLAASTIAGLHITDSPVQVFSIDGADGLHLTGITVDNRAGDAHGAHNTDAFDVGDSTGVTIEGATVYNQDDCLAVNSGSNIIFTGGYCSGGHGLSIGSVGDRSDNTVDTVHIADSQVVNSANGVRIKTIAKASGTVQGVTYTNITLAGITAYGIVIEQDYENGSPTGDPTAGVPITDLTVSDVHGTVTADAVDVYILCANCARWTWEDVHVDGGKKGNCKGVPTGASC